MRVVNLINHTCFQNYRANKVLAKALRVISIKFLPVLSMLCETEWT